MGREDGPCCLANYPALGLALECWTSHLAGLLLSERGAERRAPPLPGWGFAGETTSHTEPSRGVEHSVYTFSLPCITELPEEVKAEPNGSLFLHVSQFQSLAIQVHLLWPCVHSQVPRPQGLRGAPTLPTTRMLLLFVHLFPR